MAAAIMIAEIIGKKERKPLHAVQSSNRPPDSGNGNSPEVPFDAVISNGYSDENGERSVFSPRRFSMKASGAQLMADLKQNVIGESRQCLASLTDLFLKKLSEQEAENLWGKLPLETGCIVNFEGKKAGAYKEKNGVVWLVSLKCPHLKCRLTWNQDETSWDCPCHGSRFDYQGRLLDDPAQTGIGLGRREAAKEEGGRND